MFGLVWFVTFLLSEPAQLIAWEDSSPKRLIICRGDVKHITN